MNYVRVLHTLTVGYTFQGMATPTDFPTTTTPNKGTPDQSGNYADPGMYTAGQAYTTVECPAGATIPTGYVLGSVSVNGATATAGNGNFGTDEDFADITVIYNYVRNMVSHEDINASIRISKVDGREALITSSAATFTLYTDTQCTTSAGKTYTTATTGADAGKATITASASELGAGTYYLKETAAPTGYGLGSNVWKIEVSVTPHTNEPYNGGFTTYNKYGITASLVGSDDTLSAISAVNNQLSVPYTVEYYFENNYDLGQYTHNKTKDATVADYHDETGSVQYFDSITDLRFHLGQTDMQAIPTGYVLNTAKTEGSPVTYSGSLVIKLYYDLTFRNDLSVEGTKVWHNASGTGATYVGLFRTLGTTTAMIGEATPTTEEYSFTGLPQYVGGQAASYAVYEIYQSAGSWVKVEDNGYITLDGTKYQVTYTDNTITNTALTDISVTKTFSNTGTDISTPDSVKAAILANNAVVTKNATTNKSVGANGVLTIAKTNDGYETVTVSDLPAYDAEGEAIRYTVAECNADGSVNTGSQITLNGVLYNVTVAQTGTAYTINNAVVRDSITVTKSFSGAPALPTDFNITVTKNGAVAARSVVIPVATLTVDNAGSTNTADGVTTYTWVVSNLPKLNTYTVAENNNTIPAYTLVATSDTADKTVTSGTSASFTNIYSRDMADAFTITKVWRDESFVSARPASVTIAVSNGTDTLGTVTLGETTATTDSTAFTVAHGSAPWTAVVSGLPAKAEGNGNTITYSVVETTGSDFTYTIGYTNGGDVKANAVTVTNTRNASTNVTVSGTKTWADDSNRDGIRPDYVKVQLFADGEAMTGDAYTKTLSGETWSYSWTGLADSENGKSITYTVREIAMGYYDDLTTADDEAREADVYNETDDTYVAAYGYLPSNNGVNLINTHEPEVVTIYVEKQWASGSPRAVTVKLLNGTSVVSTATLDGTTDQGPWSHVFTSTDAVKLYKYEGGKLISYTVEEKSLGSYWSSSVKKLEETHSVFTYGFVVTNSYNEPSPYEPPIEIIPDDKPPLVEPDEPIEDIPDDDVPKADAPKTGDNLTFWILAAGVSGLSLVWVALAGKKRKDHEAQ